MSPDFEPAIGEVGPAPGAVTPEPTALRIVSGTVTWPILRMWRDGFALAVGQRIRGFVDVYDGDEHIFSCLARANGIEGGEQLFVIERRNAGRARLPCDAAADAGAPDSAVAAFEASRIGL